HAMTYLQQALALHEQLGDRRKMATLYSQIARAYSVGMGVPWDLERSLANMEQARSILEDLPESLQLGLVYVTLGSIYGGLGQPGEGLRWNEKARELGTRLNRPVLLAEGNSVHQQFLLGQVNAAQEEAERRWQLAVRHNFAGQLEGLRSV